MAHLDLVALFLLVDLGVWCQVSHQEQPGGHGRAALTHTDHIIARTDPKATSRSSIASHKEIALHLHE